MTERYAKERAIATQAALEAGACVLDFYNRQNADIYEKPDGSMVTDADLAADAIIRSILTEAFPGDPILTEEGIDDRERLQSDRVWIVDPVDGTNQFITRTGEFEVLIALVDKGRPVVGVAFQPVGDVLLTASAENGASITQANVTRPLQLENDLRSAPRVVTSSWLGAPENLTILDQVARRVGSDKTVVSDIGVTVRRFIPPTDIADVFIGLRLGRDSDMAWEWDFAAQDIIVNEAGGKTTDLSGRPHQYNKPLPRNENGLVMATSPDIHRQTVSALSDLRASED